VGSTLYADRGPPFGLSELYGDQSNVTSVLSAPRSSNSGQRIRPDPHPRQACTVGAHIFMDDVRLV
jgi:hypothetical protein